MALWLVRAGRYGEHMQRFLDTSRIYLTWKNLHCDLSKLATKDELRVILREGYPDASKGRIINNSDQRPRQEAR